jgi:hypothetical protein
MAIGKTLGIAFQIIQLIGILIFGLYIVFNDMVITQIDYAFIFGGILLIQLNLLSAILIIFGEDKPVKAKKGSDVDYY